MADAKCRDVSATHCMVQIQIIVARWLNYEAAKTIIFNVYYSLNQFVIAGVFARIFLGLMP